MRVSTTPLSRRSGKLTTSDRRGSSSLVRMSAQVYVSAYGLAKIHGALGDEESMFGALRHADDERSTLMVNICTSVAFDRYRTDPRFKTYEPRVLSAERSAIVAPGGADTRD